MAARIRFLPVFLIIAAATATISGSTAKPPPTVPPAALLPAEAIPGTPARAEFAVPEAPSTTDRDDGCTAVVHGRLLPGGQVTARGFQTTLESGQLSELLARTRTDLKAWTAQARRCAQVTVDDGDLPTVSTLTLNTPPAIPGAETLSYQQVLSLPGQTTGLRLRTVAIAADDVLLVLRDAGATDLDLDALAVAAWQHAGPRLGR
ncbi:hypothetical protein SAMN05421837_101872 [Amycolatopsis pretoriensis]|uniref:PknH-like extracellular domain-containing protein n=1 Tax=Amycolatopsis pretoriensis TaxID=218821 RepID=A0A1H5Q6D9_9PSEU|nr:hypothetical protein [Amycolatopsis pretoriensis]SEF21454.1 hypothetical protein SAMN05421837_101872 [Amycolatopsis pretoriensis]